jgi:MFS family permease
MGRNGLSAAYYWYLGVQAVSIAGTMMGYTALFWLGLHVPHGGGTALASIDAAQTLPMLLLSRQAGAIASRHSAARVLIVTQALQAAGALTIGSIMLAGQITLWSLLPICFAIGCVQCIGLPARQTFMLDLVGDDLLRRGTSQYAAVTGLGKIAGPGVAGIIIALSGETAVFFTDAVSFLGVIAVLAVLSGAALSGASQHAVVPARQPGAAKARRFRWLLDLPRGVRAATLMALLVGGFGMQFAVTNPMMARYVLHLGSAGFGLFGTCAAVGGVVGSVYSSRRKSPGRYEFIVWSAAFGAAECVASVMPSAWSYDVTLFLLGAATQLFATSATVYVQQSTPAAQRGYALSAYNAAFIGFVPAGAFIVAAIATTVGTRWALVGPGLVILACACRLGLTSLRGTPGPAVVTPTNTQPHR